MLPSSSILNESESVFYVGHCGHNHKWTGLNRQDLNAKQLWQPQNVCLCVPFTAWLEFRQKGWPTAVRLGKGSMGQMGAVVTSMRVVVHQSTNILKGSTHFTNSENKIA